MIKISPITFVNKFPARLQTFFRRGRANSRSFGSHVLLTASTNLVLAIMALVTGSLAARLLGPEGRGQLAAIQTWPLLIALLASLGLPDAVVYFTSQMPDRGGSNLASSVVLYLISSIPFVAVGYALMPFLLSAQTPEVISAARWYLLLFVPLQATQGMLLHPLRGRSDFVPWNLLRILYMFGWLAVLFLAGWTQRTTPESLAAAYLVSLVVIGLPVWYVVRRRVPGPYKMDRHLWRPMLNYGLPLAASAVPQMLNLRLDQLAMAALLPAEQLGYYVVAVAWSSATQPLLNSIGTVLFPRVASVSSRPAQLEHLAHITRISTLLALVTGIILLALTPLGILILFGTAYISAIPPAIVLVIAGAMSGVNMILEEGVRGLGVSRVVLRAEAAGLIVTIIALAGLLRPYEIMGAAVASLLGYSAIAFVLLFQLRGISQRSVLYFVRPTRADISISARRVRAIFDGLISHGNI